MKTQSAENCAETNEDERVSKLNIFLLSGEVFEDVLRDESSAGCSDGHEERKETFVEDEVFSDAHIAGKLSERNRVKVGITIADKGSGEAEIEDDLSVGLIRNVLLFGRLNLEQLPV